MVTEAEGSVEVNILAPGGYLLVGGFGGGEVVGVVQDVVHLQLELALAMHAAP